MGMISEVFKLLHREVETLQHSRIYIPDVAAEAMTWNGAVVSAVYGPLSGPEALAAIWALPRELYRLEPRTKTGRFVNMNLNLRQLETLLLQRPAQPEQQKMQHINALDGVSLSYAVKHGAAQRFSRPPEHAELQRAFEIAQLPLMEQISSKLGDQPAQQLTRRRYGQAAVLTPLDDHWIAVCYPTGEGTPFELAALQQHLERIAKQTTIAQRLHQILPYALALINEATPRVRLVVTNQTDKLTLPESRVTKLYELENLIKDACTSHPLAERIELQAFCNGNFSTFCAASNNHAPGAPSINQ